MYIVQYMYNLKIKNSAPYMGPWVIQPQGCILLFSFNFPTSKAPKSPVSDGIPVKIMVNSQKLAESNEKFGFY